MRPAGRGPLESLYFTYPRFEPPGPQATRRFPSPLPVVVVGAGPVGMVAALELARQGVKAMLLDAKPTFNDGSRAICISRSSFHILDGLGALGPFLRKALPWTTGRSFYRGRQILEFEMPDSRHEKFRPMYNLQQQYIEAFLWQAVKAQPLIEARWQTEVTGLGDHVLTVRDPGGSYEIPFDWAIAADGARSAMRRLCGLRLEGENFEGRYVIADVKMRHDYPTIRRALFDPDCRRGGTVLVHRQPDDIWRIDYQLAQGESAEAATDEAAVRANVAAVLAEIGHDGPWDLEWWSVYSANTLALRDYRHGRVFFAGDSAHIVPIFGVRGLNNGLADAQNIGWKLGFVLTGRAGEGVLDSYTPERRGATLDVFANAVKSTRFMTPPTYGWRLMRDAALSLALRAPWAGDLANPRQMTPYTYQTDAPTGWDGAPQPGAMLPARAVPGGNLTDGPGPGFALLVCGAPPDLPGLAVRALPEGMFGARPGDAVLVRPDLHVAASWRGVDAATVRAEMARQLDREG